MKKLAMLISLCLVSVLAFSQDVPRDSVRLGERVVDFHADRDVIPVGPYDGWFKDIVFWVERNNVELFNLVVTYENGQKEKFGTRLVFDEGTRSRVIHLEGAKRRIRNIAFTYRTAGKWVEGRARVVVYGIK